MFGQLRMFAPNQEEVWRFSPFNYLSILRWMRRDDAGPVSPIGRCFFYSAS